MTFHRSFLVVLVLGLAACDGGPKDTPVKDDAVANKAPTPATADKPHGAADAAPVEVEPLEPEDEFSAYDPRVAQAARVALEIQADPTKVETVLASAEIDREALDALMYEIAGNPELSKQYRIARGMAAPPVE